MTFEEFLRESDVSEFEKDVLWTLVAEAMRAQPDAHGVELLSFLKPFAYFLSQIGAAPSKLKLVADELRDGEFTFPFGWLRVDHGVVDRIQLESDA